MLFKEQVDLSHLLIPQLLKILKDEYVYLEENEIVIAQLGKAMNEIYQSNNPTVKENLNIMFQLMNYDQDYQKFALMLLVNQQRLVNLYDENYVPTYDSQTSLSKYRKKGIFEHEKAFIINKYEISKLFINEQIEKTKSISIDLTTLKHENNTELLRLIKFVNVLIKDIKYRDNVNCVSVTLPASVRMNDPIIDEISDSIVRGSNTKNIIVSEYNNCYAVSGSRSNRS